MKAMWIIILLLAVFTLGMFVLISFTPDNSIKDEQEEQNEKAVTEQKHNDPNKLFRFETDQDMEQTKTQALVQYKVCPPLRPERFRRRVKMLWGIDIKDYPENALIKTAENLSVKYQIFKNDTVKVVDLPGDPPSPVPDVDEPDSIFAIRRRYLFISDTTMGDDLRKHPQVMYDIYYKADSNAAEAFHDEILNSWYDYFLACYNSQYSISPSLIRYVDKIASLDPYPKPHFLMRCSGEPTRVSDIKRDLMLLFMKEELAKGRVLCSRSDIKNGLYLGTDLNRRHNWNIDEITDPNPNYPSEAGSKYPWKSNTQERGLAAYFSFMLQLQEPLVNKTVIMFMSGQLDDSGFTARMTYKILRDSIRSNDYYGYAVLREFCENPEREMPTLEKVGTSFKGVINGEKSLLYLEPFPDSFDIDTIRPDETFKAYEMGHDDYYFVEVVKPDESPVAGTDGYAMIIDRTETVFGYMKKAEVRKFTDEDALNQTVTTGKSKQGIINDPDGYVNIRKEMNANSKILGKIEKKEIFTYWEVPGSNWNVVKTQDGILGFVYKDRIKEKPNTSGWVILGDDE